LFAPGFLHSTELLDDGVKPTEREAVSFVSPPHPFSGFVGFRNRPVDFTESDDESTFEFSPRFDTRPLGANDNVEFEVLYSKVEKEIGTLPDGA